MATSTTLKCGLIGIFVLLTASVTPEAQTSADIVIHAADAVDVRGTWQKIADNGAASGSRLWQPDAGVPKLAAAATPQHYFDVQFQAEGGRAYRLWIRSKADNNYWGNDSIYVQFSKSVNASGAPVYRIGTTSATTIVREDCSGCAFSGWGWQDNEYGNVALGPEIRFAESGHQTIRIQAREDGISIDQIVLSSATWFTTPPGAKNNDTTIHPKTVTPPPTSSKTMAFTRFDGVGLGFYAGVAAVDLNGDGKRDLAGLLWDDTEVYAAVNDGARAFHLSYAAEFWTSTTDTSRVVAADFTGDRKADLLELDPHWSMVAVFEGDGAGGFSRAITTSFPERVQDVAVADFTGDGILDLAAVEPERGNVVVHAGDGAGRFSFVSFAAVGSTPTEIVAGDFDGDRRQDVAVVCSGSLALLHGDGTGRFQRFAAIVTLQPVALGAADLDRDGFSDVVVGLARASAHIKYGSPSGLAGGVDVTTSARNGAEIVPRGVAFGDMNGDGATDILITHADTSSRREDMSTFAVVPSAGSRSFGAAVVFAKLSSAPAVVADLDDDGRPDVISPESNRGVSIHWNDPADANRPPVADAGSDATVMDTDQATFRLNGLGSADPDGHALDYQWVRSDGTRLTGPTPLAFENGGMQPGTYTFTLTVNDRQGGTSTDTVTVTIQRPGPDGNRPPVARVFMTLDGVWPYEKQFQDMPDPETAIGSQSTDPDGDTLTCEWRNAAGEVIATVCGWDTGTGPSFAPGTHALTLTVRDGRGGESSTTASLTVKNYEEIVIPGAGYKESVVGTEWEEVEDPGVSGHYVVRDLDAGAPKVNAPLASPGSYVEYGFVADPTLEYKLWIRLKAQNDYWGNDSIWVQFRGAVDASGNPVFRAATTSGLAVNLEECNGCGVAGYGWRDEAWGTRGAMSTSYLRFPQGGVQGLRIQTREDGVLIDTIVLSARKYKTTRPGAVKNDATKLMPTAFWGS